MVGAVRFELATPTPFRFAKCFVIRTPGWLLYRKLSNDFESSKVLKRNDVHLR
jgi:hypothetical protein